MVLHMVEIPGELINERGNARSQAVMAISDEPKARAAPGQVQPDLVDLTCSFF